MRYLFLILFFVGFSTTTIAEDAQSKAEVVVANILFDYDYGSEFATYKVNEDGFVDLTMASNTPDKVYGEILTRMKNHPDIDDVLASKSGPACQITNW